jgi:hypothetical protein
LIIRDRGTYSTGLQREQSKRRIDAGFREQDKLGGCLLTAAPKPDGKSLPISEELRAAYVRVSDKVQRFEDESAIENLQGISGFYIDTQLWREAADLFAHDGTLEIGGQGVFAGKSRALEYLTRISPDGLTRGKLYNHIQLQPIVEIAPDGKTGKGRWVNSVNI